LHAQLELAGRSFPKGQLKHADRLGARFVALLGADGVALRQMDTGEQTETASEGLIAQVLRRR
jgi:histidyl-tRNA synthetase